MTPQEIEALKIEALKDKAEALSDMVEILKAERDALLQELHKANSIIIDLQRNPPKFTAEYLRDIKAEAGREGFIAGATKWIAAVHPDYADDATVDIEADADKYAAAVRQGTA